MKPSPISNSKLTLLRKLRRKKYRKSERLFLAEGARAVEQIIKNRRLAVKELFFDESQPYWEQRLWKTLAGTIDSFLVAEKDFTAVSDTENPQGVMAMCRMPEAADPSELVHQSGLMIAADAVQDPGNLGTIIRTAAWFGVQGILSGKGTVDLFHPKVVRATAGATGAVSYSNVNLQETLSFFERKGWQIILLDADDDSVPLGKIKKRDKRIIVVGNEANGIDKSLFTLDRTKVQIGASEDAGVESLNVAIALAVSLYALSD